MRTIGNKLKALPFSEDSMDGFAIERVRDDFIEGRYIEKYIYQEFNSDPLAKKKSLNELDTVLRTSPIRTVPIR